MRQSSISTPLERLIAPSPDGLDARMQAARKAAAETARDVEVGEFESETGSG